MGCAAATFAAILAYALALREPYVATARISIGHVATQFGSLGPAAFVPIEDVDKAERHVQREVLSELGSAAFCSAQGQVGDRLYIHVACAAGDREEARRRAMAVVESVLSRHREKFEVMLQPLQQRLASEKRRLDRMSELQRQRLSNSPAGSTRSEQGRRMPPDNEGFLLANEILSLQSSLEMNTLLCKLDRMTTLDAPGVVVTEKRLRPSLVAAALLVSLAFGAFVSLAIAAAALMRRGGYRGSDNP